VVNGTEAKITAVVPNHKRGGYNVSVDIEEKGGVRKLTFNTEEWNAIQHNYARTVHGAQGQGKTDVFLLGNAGMTDSSSLMVAISRVTKGKFTLYATADNVETIRQRAALDHRKENTLHAGIRGTEGQDITKLFDSLKVKPNISPIKIDMKSANTRTKKARVSIEDKEMSDWVQKHVDAIKTTHDAVTKQRANTNTQRI